MMCEDHGRHSNLTKAGYAKVYVAGLGQCLLHRKVYAEAHGVPLCDLSGKVIRHTCDNTRCINPRHLLVGTQADNMRDMVERGRAKSVDVAARTFTEDEIKSIRGRYKPRCKFNGMNAIAREFNVAVNTIYQIMHRITYYG